MIKLKPLHVSVFLLMASAAFVHAVDVSIVASDPWGNKFGAGDPVAFTVTRTGATTSPLTVNVAVAGSATPGTDYPALASTLNIPAGQASAVTVITPNTSAPDRLGTPPSIVVSLAAGAYVISATSSATAYIAPSSYAGGGEDMHVQMRKVTTTTGGNYELQIPQRNGADIPVIRGILLSAPGDGGTDASGDFDRWCYDNNFSFLNQKFASDVASKPISGLNALASTSGHPEVQFAPICARGFSRGGGLASNMAKDYPARTLAFYSRGWSQSKWSASSPYAPTAATANVPGWFDEGAVDGYSGVVRTGFDRGRAVGALWCYSEYNGEGHGSAVAADMARNFFDICIALRYDYQPGVSGKDPTLGAVTLTTLTESSGWIGEHLYGKNRNAWTDIYSAETPNWHRDFETRNPFVCPFAAFDRTDSDTRQHSWFPNERMARLWAQHTGMGWDSLALQFSNGSPYLVNAGQSLACTLDTGGFPEAVKAEFFVDETKVAESTTPPYAYTFVVTTVGSHYLWARATSANGAVRVTSGHSSSQAGYGERLIRVRPASELGNTAPTISPIPKITLRDGDATGVTIPFTIGDTETAAGNLNIDNNYWRINYPFGGKWTITGSGASRQLTIVTGGAGTSATTPGFYRGSIKVSDGFLSTDQAIEVEVRPAVGSNAPAFVTPSAGNVALEANDSMWSSTATFFVTDGDASASQMLATFTNSNLTKLPTANIRLSQWGPVRSLRVRTVNDGWNSTALHLALSDGVNTTSATQDAYFANVPAQKPNEAPWIATIPDQSCTQGGQTTPQFIRLGDLNWLPDELVVTATSSNPTLLPNANITIATLGNSLIDRERSVVCLPAAGQSGTATVTLTVTEPAANIVAPVGPLASTRTFVLTVNPSGTSVVVTGVSLSPSSTSVMVGSNTALNATVAPANATNAAVNWSSSNPGVATVSASGVVRGVSAGTATITVTTVDGGFSASCIVTVTPVFVAVTGVSVTPTTASVVVGATTTLNATVAPANASTATVTWASSNSAKATVTSAGVVTGIAAGTVTITATTVSGGFSASCVVTVTPALVPVTGVTVTPTTASVAVGATTTLNATVAPANASTATVTWASSDSAKATVTSAGVVTGVAAGTVTITATTVDGGFSASCTVTVTPVTVSDNRRFNRTSDSQGCGLGGGLALVLSLAFFSMRFVNRKA